jgi:hypothetical protein
MSEAMEVRQLEQAAKEVNESLSAFHQASKVLNEKASAFITDAKKESEIILQDAKNVVHDAKKEAGSILAGAVEVVQDAEKKAKAILAVAVEETNKLKAEQNAFVQDAQNKADTIAADSAIIVHGAKDEAETILAGAAEEVKRWEAEKEAISKVQQFEPIVKLNVGGVRYTTSLTTLRRFPDTMLGSMFSGRHTLPKGEDGYFFIDRDGTHFHHILNFLRSPESYKMEVKGEKAYRSQEKEDEERELRLECEYYCLTELMFPVTVKSLPYYDLSAYTQNIAGAYLLLPAGSIAVRIDYKGVHTILDSEGKIEYCHHCRNAFFNIGAQKYFSNAFNDESPPAAQPKVQGRCPRCRQKGIAYGQG